MFVSLRVNITLHILESNNLRQENNYVGRVPRAKSKTVAPIRTTDWSPELDPQIQPPAELVAMAAAVSEQHADDVLARVPIPAQTHLSRMSPQDKLLREMFVVEYFYDRDAYAAAVRLGYPPAKAREIGYKLENEPVVQRLIRERELEFADAHEITLSRLAGFYLREIADRGVTSSQSARVASIGALGKLVGLGQPEKLDVTITGGVMEVPPVAVDADWEVVASTTQPKLLADVRRE